jgi:hypothetical protein
VQHREQQDDGGKNETYMPSALRLQDGSCWEVHRGCRRVQPETFLHVNERRVERIRANLVTALLLFGEHI